MVDNLQRLAVVSGAAIRLGQQAQIGVAGAVGADVSP